jgi:hypothetical protein
LCIADDIGDGYTHCGDYRERNACDAAFTTSGHRCDWYQGECITWSRATCLMLLAQAQQTGAWGKVLPLSEYRRSRLSDVFKAEFCNYDEVELVYSGHGPSADEFAQMLADAVASSDQARRLLVRSDGCSTFANLPLAKQWIEAQFDRTLHASAWARLREMNVRTSANQLMSVDGGLRRGMVRLELSQSPITLQVSVYGERTLRVEIDSLYPCKSQSGRALFHVARRCNARESGARSLCNLQNGVRSEEKCGEVSYLNSLGNVINTHAVIPLSPGYLDLSYDKDAHRFSSLSYADAETACAQSGKRLASYDEVVRIIEGHNLFRWLILTDGNFLSRRNVTRGKVWSSTPSTQRPGSVFVYVLQSHLSNGEQTYFSAPTTSGEGFYFCVER